MRVIRDVYKSKPGERTILEETKIRNTQGVSLREFVDQQQAEGRANCTMADCALWAYCHFDNETVTYPQESRDPDRLRPLIPDLTRVVATVESKCEKVECPNNVGNVTLMADAIREAATVPTESRA